MLLCSKVTVNSLAILPGIFLKYVLAFLQSFAYVLFSSSKKSAVIIASNPHSHPADCFGTRIGTRNQNSRIHCDFVNCTHHRATVRIYTAASLLLKSEIFDGVVMRTHVRTHLQWCIFYSFLHLTGVWPGSVRPQTQTIAPFFFSKSFQIPQPSRAPWAAYLPKSAQCQKPSNRKLQFIYQFIYSFMI